MTIQVCVGSSCHIKGSPEIVELFQKAITENNLENEDYKTQWFYYYDYLEFEGCVDYLLSHSAEYVAMCGNARAYIDRYYDWNVIMEQFRRMISEVTG